MATAPAPALLLLCTLLAACSSGTNRPADTAERPAPAAPAAPAVVEPAAEPGAVAEDATDESGPAALSRTTESGFLKDYSRLRPVQGHEHVLAERSPTLGAYKSFIIEAPEMLATATIDGKKLNNQVQATLANDLKSALVQSLAVNFTITDKPGPGVARVRSAVTQVGECLHHPDSAQRRIGGATGELEIVDSVSGERLAAAVAADAVKTRDPLLVSDDTWYDVRLVFKHWGARLAKALSDADQ